VDVMSLESDGRSSKDSIEGRGTRSRGDSGGSIEPSSGTEQLVNSVSQKELKRPPKVNVARRPHARERSMSQGELEMLASRGLISQGLGVSAKSRPGTEDEFYFLNKANRLPRKSFAGSEASEEEDVEKMHSKFSSFGAGEVETPLSLQRQRFLRDRSLSAHISRSPHAASLSSRRLVHQHSMGNERVTLLRKFVRPQLRLRSPSFRMKPVDSPTSAPVQQTYGTAESTTSPPLDLETPQTYMTPLLPADSRTAGGMEYEKESTAMQKLFECFIYGMVNSILTVPCMYGYAAIIFRDSAFQTSLAELSKLVLFSSVIHQCVFSVSSSLRFSIGQVQDAGLIFLSTMATSVAKNASPDAIIPTTLVTLSLATALLGVVVYILGRLRLAKLISYLPMPVVGGYLAFIGFFCFLAGIGLCIGEDVSSILDLQKAFNMRALKLASPAIVGGGILAIAGRKAERWYTLPICIIALPMAFYVFMSMTDLSFAEAQEQGWMQKPRTGEVTSAPFWCVWELFDFKKVEWGILPREVVTWISMVFVVSFSSCLDVVAIEMDMGKELDINHELCTVGLSNLASGITGGYTGSYIFSQTIFTFRTGTDSRFVGMIVIIAELGLFMSPFNVMEYVPLYFFAATLIFIALDLLTEWLVEVSRKVSFKEYLVLLGTFLIITYTNDLVFGIVMGIILAVCNFILAYSSVTHIQRTFKTSSNVVRDVEKRRTLKRLKNKVARLDLHGFLFFGSAVQITKKLRILIEESKSSKDEDDGLMERSEGTEDPWKILNGRNGNIWDRFSKLMPSFIGGGGSSEAEVHIRESSTDHNNEEGNWASEGMYQSFESTNPSPRLFRQLSHQTSVSAEDDDCGIRYLILDFTRVTGMDATAISAGLMRVKQLAIMHNIRIVFTSLRPEFQHLLEVNHILNPEDENNFCIMFQETYDGCEWVENRLLEEYGKVGRSSPRLRHLSASKEEPEMPDVPFAFNLDGSRNKVLMSIASHPECKSVLAKILVDFFGLDETVEDSMGESQFSTFATMTEFFGLMRLRKGEYVFHVGDLSDAIYIVMVGEVTLFVPASQIHERLQNRRDVFWHSKKIDDERLALLRGGKLLQRAKYGCIFGEIQFTLQERRHFAAVATEDSAVFFLRKNRLEELQTRDPKLALELFRCLTQFLALTVSDLQQYKNFVVVQ